VARRVPAAGGPAARRPAARAAYAQLKGRLAAQFSGDRGAYTAAKAAFIVQLLSEDRQLR
jgi:GrpB-like predicted nucleotidyltransferase (UPF0157 family)